MVAPQCSACRQPILGAHTIADGASYHASCFVCAICGEALTAGYYIGPDGRPLCERDMAIASGVQGRERRDSRTAARGTVSAASRRLPRPAGAHRGLDTKAMLAWAQAAVALGAGGTVHVTDFSGSWADGRAFVAIVRAYFPEAMGVPGDAGAGASAVATNCERAFGVAQEEAGVPQLLDVADMVNTFPHPDEKCMITYLASLWGGLSAAAARSD